MELRPLGSTGIMVSPLGLGTVKFGRNEQVKYPHPFEIPDDKAVANLLTLAQELGINLLDTAPAYGNCEERIGKLLPGRREDWVIVSKVGEFFENGRSRFDFSYDTTLRTVEQSLRNLKTDYLDGVLIHSDGDDLRILEHEGVLDALRVLKEKGVIRSHGMSSKTVEGGLLAVEETDIVMATCNLAYQDEMPVLEAAADKNKGLLIKKALQSGSAGEAKGVAESLRFVFTQAAGCCVIVGTISSAHLRFDVMMTNSIVGDE
ncbi:aldo/keto reductase [Pseudomonadota bacterium]